VRQTYGQLAGAFYGVQGIPEHWRKKIAFSDRIIELADGLLALAGNHPTGDIDP